MSVGKWSVRWYFTVYCSQKEDLEMKFQKYTKKTLFTGTALTQPKLWTNIWRNYVDLHEDLMYKNAPSVHEVMCTTWWLPSLANCDNDSQPDNKLWKWLWTTAFISFQVDVSLSLQAWTHVGGFIIFQATWWISCSAVAFWVALKLNNRNIQSMKRLIFIL